VFLNDNWLTQNTQKSHHFVKVPREGSRSGHLVPTTITRIFSEMSVRDDVLLGFDPFELSSFNGDSSNGPLKCLRPSTITFLSTMLNPLKIIPTESGLARDWRGLAELGGVTAEMITYFESKPNPTSDLLRHLTDPNNPGSPAKTVNDLRAFLGVIDRFDVSDDASPLLDSDIKFYNSRLRLSTADKSQLPDPSSERELLTYDDTVRLNEGKSPSRYDAFILYSEEEEDREFAMSVVEKMETEYNLKMCFKERDLMPGVMFEHEVIGRVIEERCNRLLIIFSPSFLESQANQFLVSYTQALALETRQRKIIPVMYKRCALPPSVRYSFCLNFNRSGKLWNFWDRLSQSLTSVIPGSVPVRNGTTTSTQPWRGASLPLPDSLSWFDNDKDESPLKSSVSPSDSGYTDDGDNCSITSASPILSKDSGKAMSGISPSKKGWLRKLNPMRKKREKEKAMSKSLDIAE